MAVSPEAAEIAGELPIIASHHIGLHHLPRWLRQLRKCYPDVSLSPQFLESDAAYGQMLKRHAELGFVTLSDSMAPGFQIHAQWQDPMAFVCGPDHPWPSNPSHDWNTWRRIRHCCRTPTLPLTGWSAACFWRRTSTCP